MEAADSRLEGSPLSDVSFKGIGMRVRMLAPHRRLSVRVGWDARLLLEAALCAAGWQASALGGLPATPLCEALAHESVTHRNPDLVARWLGLSQTRADFVKTLLSNCAFALEPRNPMGTPRSAIGTPPSDSAAIT